MPRLNIFGNPRPEAEWKLFSDVPPLTEDEMERLLPCSRAREEVLRQCVREIRAFGMGVFCERRLLPPHLR